MARVRAALYLDANRTVAASLWDWTGLDESWQSDRREQLRASLLAEVPAVVEATTRGMYRQSVTAGFLLTLARDVSGPGWLVAAEQGYPPDAAVKLANDLGRVDLTERTSRAQCEDLLRKFRDPDLAEPIQAIRADIEATRATMVESIAAVAERGEKLADLVGRSTALSAGSRALARVPRPWWHWTQLFRCCLLCMARKGIFQWLVRRAHATRHGRHADTHEPLLQVRQGVQPDD